MNPIWTILRFCSFLCILGGLAAIAFHVAKAPVAPRPTLGARGFNRSRALRHGLLFPLLEPVIRVVAAWVGAIRFEQLRSAAARSLTRAGEYLGFSEDELLAVCALSGLSAGTCSLLVCELLGLHLAFAVAGFTLGSSVPWFRLRMVGRERARSVCAALPAAVELAAMCMSAGLDFPGSLKRIVDTASSPREPIIEEFNRILQELDLGHTRRSAMERFAARIPTDQVREFVSSVVQAEQKGTPLATVLSIQAQTQRLRRSVAAEETASEAALMLLGPMTLIFLCVIVLLLGPVVVRFMTGGLGPA